MVEGKRGFTYKELAQYYGKSARTWRHKVAQGKIVAIKDGGTVLILQEDLDRYFARHRQVRGGESETQDANQ